MVKLPELNATMQRMAMEMHKVHGHVACIAPNLNIAVVKTITRSTS